MKKIYSFIIFLFYFLTNANSQCNNNGGNACGNNGGDNYGTITPTSTWQSVTIVNGNTGYWTFAATNGTTYEFRTCVNNDMELTIQTSANANRRTYDNDRYNCGGSGNNEWAIYTASATGNHVVRYSRNGTFSNCNNTTNSGTLEYRIYQLPNDNLCSAQDFGTLPLGYNSGWQHFNNYCATLQAGEPTPQSEYNTVWYKFTTPASGLVSVTGRVEEQNGSDNTSLSLYRLTSSTCSFGNLSSVIVTDYGCFNSFTEVSTNCLLPNTTYYWQVGTTDCTLDGGDPFEYRFRMTASIEVTGPDNICSAQNLGVIPLGYNSGWLNVNNVCATTEPGEPRISEMFNTIWYQFTTPSTGLNSIDIDVEEFGGGSDNVAVALYESSSSCSFADLSEKAFNRWCASSGGRISYNCLLPNTTYYIQLGTANNFALCIGGQTPGNYRLRIFASGILTGPDNICSAVDFGSVSPGYSSGWQNFNNLCATLEPGEPTPQDIYNTVWYKFTTPASGLLRVTGRVEEVSDSDNTALALYESTGACSVGNLSAVLVSDYGVYKQFYRNFI
jgi:hypothetical protein